MFKRFISENKGQTALEVILIVAGVLILVTIIGYYIKTKVVSVQDENKFIDVINKTKGNN
jgi:uncharacterized protein (UPF0333 family)